MEERGIYIERVDRAGTLQLPELVRDYVSGRERATSLFDYQARIDEHWQDRVKELDERDPNVQSANREMLADTLLNYNRRIGNKSAALDSASLLANPETLVVVGGQQGGLLTGPLLVWYKAITVLHTARQAERRLGRKVVPVFWIAGEDHDWDEVNHTYVQSAQSEPHKLKLEDGAAATRTSVSLTPLDPGEVDRIFAELATALPETEFKPDIMSRLRTAADGADSLSDWFARVMAEWFGDAGLVLLDSADPGIRRLESDMFRRLIEERASYAKALAAGDAEVRERGYSAQADVRESSANLFLLHEGERLLLFEQDGCFSDRKGKVTLNRQELFAIAESQPHSLSNNVLTRPVMQDYVLPVLAVVLGPSEIAYWAQIKQAFHLFGMKMPIVVPRMSFTLLEGGVRKQLDKYGVSLGEAIDGSKLAARKAAWLAAQDEWGADERFEKLKLTIMEEYEPILRMAEDIQPALRKLGDTNLGKVLEQVAFLRQKTTDALASRHEAGLRQFDRIEKSLHPLSKPQERVYNGFGYLSKYGQDWLDRLIVWEGGDMEGGHYTVTI